MAVESAQQDVQVSVGKDFVIMGGDRVEVSPDGKKVTAYTNPRPLPAQPRRASVSARISIRSS
jgi:uncharacterized protein (DUF2345 family)